MINKKDKGFTLVELLIVIVILGILATVTVFAVRGITDQGEKNACKVERRTVETAIESYYAQNQSEPTSEAQLVPDYLKEAPSNVTITYGATDTVTPTISTCPV
ncbi:type II secretion system protein [Ilumatobacter sp.]|uniref:type II secretion system protein n=1 Tax=Ilumatobacter sp. TaxID=1967498 RepID=UPI003B517784